MPEGQTIAWNFRSRVLEAAVIIVSILIAFGLDSWWADVEERRSLEDQLSTVLEEMERNRQHLREWMEIHARIGTSVDAILAIPSASENGPVMAVADSLLAGALLVATTNPSSGGVRMLTNSGRLALVENRHLRVALSGWDDFVADVAEDEAAGYSWSADNLYASAQANWTTETWQANRRLNTHFWRNRLSGEVLPGGESEIPLTDAFLNLLTTKRAFAENSMREIEDLLGIVEQIIGWIEEEIG